MTNYFRIGFVYLFILLTIFTAPIRSVLGASPSATLPSDPAMTNNTAAVVEIPDAPVAALNPAQADSPLSSNMPRSNTDQPLLIPNPPPVSAKAYLLIDANNGMILAQKAATQRMEPASLTKMMSLYVISSALKSGQIHLEDNVKISEHAWRTGGSRMFLKLGDTVTVKDLIQGIVVDSGNDACVALAEHVGGNEAAFTDLMNQTAARLGMSNTHYTDSTGLPDPNHYSTAQDLSILARALLKHFPEYYPWYNQKTFTYNKITQPNRNRLLWRDNSVDGIKTGHTDSAGFCLVASAQRQGMRLIAVVLASPNDIARSNDSEALLTYGYRFYESHKLYAANTALSKLRVWSGKTPYTSIGPLNDMYITVPSGQYRNLKAQLVLDSGELQAPASRGQQHGKLLISLNGKVLSSIPLFVLNDVPTGGLFARAVDHLAYMFHRG